MAKVKFVNQIHEQVVFCSYLNEILERLFAPLERPNFLHCCCKTVHVNAVCIDEHCLGKLQNMLIPTTFTCSLMPVNKVNSHDFYFKNKSDKTV